MKKIYTLLLAAFLCVSAFANSYIGNGKTGFGGAVGTGSLDVSTDLTNIIFTFNRGVGEFNDILVIYIDSRPFGGFPSTKNFTDAQYELQRAISGYDGGVQRSVFNFNSDFKPEYALAFGAKRDAFPGGAVLDSMAKSLPFKFISQPAMSDSISNVATSYTVSILASDIGLNFNPVFHFMATYISSTGYRSDEAIGDPMTGFVQGYTDYTSTTSPLLFDKALPVVLGNFNGALNGQSANLAWTTKTEINCKQFELQKSNNASTWQTVGTISAKNISTGTQYSFIDKNVTDNKTYYRLKLISLDGTYTYSSIIILRKGVFTAIDLLGNPVRDIINLSITNADAASYKLELFTVDGRKVASQNYIHSGGTGTTSMRVPGSVKGNCLLTVTNGTSKETLKIFIDK
ncbi:MAG TPA: hypothetical protein PLA68_03205 [Panacibacter sp.]|nr:hypothetical protein [Panacibacter sp.]